MQRLRAPDALRRAADEARRSGARVGLVPTLGALHAGHARLIEEASRRAGWVVVSIFVNPTQFGPNEDFARYPRTLEADTALAKAAGAHAVFAPEVEHLYPAGEETRVVPGASARPLCGPHRPGHFEGVATIVAKLFAIAGPCVSVFGQKDYQQLRIVQRLVADLLLPVEIVPVATVREPDGLALSSRNRYLGARERERALGIARGLDAAFQAFATGERSASTLEALARAPVEESFDVIDYVEVADADTLAPFAPQERVPDHALVAIAARMGATRLIDNLVLGQDASPFEVR